ncbi:hypothetical protein HPB50_004659 [Hyalomma asiaticum]|uniref:Uncharacterized protein n=1 Tax=Hyalomma asiaticum TaxID=266040 RepID=A0ACB7RKB0_HYAAI|nr:hypothetical protein HPB50_004659 [Hyalomma asiaticum]
MGVEEEEEESVGALWHRRRAAEVDGRVGRGAPAFGFAWRCSLFLIIFSPSSSSRLLLLAPFCCGEESGRLIRVGCGFSEFHSRYPEWCDSGEPQEPTVSTSSSSPPGSAGTTTPGPVSVTTTRALLGLETLRISTECGSPKDPREDPDRCDSGLARDDSPGGADPPFPVQIVPFLYLGNEENSLDLDSLERHNIRYVLNVTHNLANAFEGRGLKYMKIPIEDHWSQNLASFFPQAIAFIGGSNVFLSRRFPPFMLPRRDALRECSRLVYPLLFRFEEEASDKTGRRPVLNKAREGCRLSC